MHYLLVIQCIISTDQGFEWQLRTYGLYIIVEHLKSSTASFELYGLAWGYDDSPSLRGNMDSTTVSIKISVITLPTSI